ncbi:MAG: hypothetical protein J0M03_02875 [Acidobacteria bacterium]|nr:hypothetical protein [Acidobacteriota bacterium]
MTRAWRTTIIFILFLSNCTGSNVSQAEQNKQKEKVNSSQTKQNLIDNANKSDNKAFNLQKNKIDVTNIDVISQQIGKDEWEEETGGLLNNFGGDGSKRSEIRTTTKEFIKLNYPKWQINGISTLSITGTYYLVGVDLASEKQKKVINLIARLFFSESGQQYWLLEATNLNAGQTIQLFTLMKINSFKLKNDDE